MHHYSIYASPKKLDFKLLAEAVPALRPFISVDGTGYASLNFDDAEAVRQLTYAFLQRDFQIRIGLPEDRLCPGVPGRFDYVLYMLDLAGCGQSERALGGVDIGTGASCIYSLLAARSSADVSMFATDSDDLSFFYAQRNVASNDLATRISVVKVDATQPFLAFLPTHSPILDFSICNPPFYSSTNEMATLTQAKQLAPAAACTGAPSEMITSGGEVAFIKRMLDEKLHDRIRWVSSLCGKLSSVVEVVAQLKRMEIDNVAVSELQQGKTRRWVVAWSVHPQRLPDALARSDAPALFKLQPPSNLAAVRLANHATDLRAHLNSLLEEMGVISEMSDEVVLVEARSMSWSRRERRERQRLGASFLATPATTAEPVLRCRITVGTNDLQVEFLFGRQRAIFDSQFSREMMADTQDATMPKTRLRERRGVTLDDCLGSGARPSGFRLGERSMYL